MRWAAAVVSTFAGLSLGADEITPVQPIPKRKADAVDAATGQWEANGLKVSLKLAQVNNVDFIRPGGKWRRSDEKVLALYLVLDNQSDTRKVSFAGWQAEPGKDRLTDNFGNAYASKSPGRAEKACVYFYTKDKVAGTFHGSDLPTAVRRPESGFIIQGDRESIYPMKALTEMLVYEVPIEKAEFLILELPAANLGGEGVIRFKIPRSMWVK